MANETTARPMTAADFKKYGIPQVSKGAIIEGPRGVFVGLDFAARPANPTRPNEQAPTNPT